MKKSIFILAVLTMVVGFTSCTENSSARNWGGTAEMVLPSDTKLIEVTWKGADLWYLTRPMREDESPEEYRFHEESSWGVWEGTYVIKEVKSEHTTPSSKYMPEQPKL